MVKVEGAAENNGALEELHNETANNFRPEFKNEMKSTQPETFSWYRFKYFSIFILLIGSSLNNKIWVLFDKEISSHHYGVISKSNDFWSQKK